MIVSSEINKNHIKTYSDAGYIIKQVETGRLFSSAVDTVPLKYTYEETSEYIDSQSEIERKAQAYDILMGVSE